MKKAVRIKISEYYLAQKSELIKSYGLGSCVAVVIWDPKKKIGAMAHILLPSSNNSSDASAKYASSAVATMLGELVKAGANQKHLIAKLAGGANMFPRKFNPYLQGPGANIGRRNIQAARKALLSQKIPIVAEDVGGEIGRTIEFNSETGELFVHKSNGETKII
jgi:chemotaxis protein CheD